MVINFGAGPAKLPEEVGLMCVTYISLMLPTSVVNCFGLLDLIDKNCKSVLDWKTFLGLS